MLAFTYELAVGPKLVWRLFEKGQRRDGRDETFAIRTGGRRSGNGQRCSLAMNTPRQAQHFLSVARR